MEKVFEFVNNTYIVWEYSDSCVFSVGEDTDPFTGEIISPIRKANSWDMKQRKEGEEEYVKNYGNPFCTVQHSRTTICIEKTEEKCVLKVFNYQRIREKGKVYFKVYTDLKYISYNFKTNSLYRGGIRDYHKKRKFYKYIKKNPFYNIPISGMKSFISGCLEYANEYKIKENGFAGEVIEKFLNTIPGFTEFIDKNKNESVLDYLFYKFHLEKWGIKVPNNLNGFICVFPQPKKKDFVKNKLKFIDTFMSLHNLKGDRVRKILHGVHFYSDGNIYKWVLENYGPDVIAKESDEFQKKLFEVNLHLGSVTTQGLTKKEKENSYKILKLVMNGEINAYTFSDHFNMLSKLKNFEEVRWDATTYESFNEEHFRISEKLSFYTKGEYKREYKPEFISGVEKVIGDEFYPVILKNSREYNMESFKQSNCVKGYVDRPRTIIISLRKGGVDSETRATIEYVILPKKNGENVEFKRQQTLGRFNHQLTEEWAEPVSQLDNRLKEVFNTIDFNGYDVKYEVGYKIVETRAVFKPNQNNDLELTWENKNFDSLNSIF